MANKKSDRDTTVVKPCEVEDLIKKKLSPKKDVKITFEFLDLKKPFKCPVCLRETTGVKMETMMPSAKVKKNHINRKGGKK